MSDMTQPATVAVVFLRPWGHPTDSKIFGPGDRALVSDRIAERLVTSGFAVRVAERTVGREPVSGDSV